VPAADRFARHRRLLGAMRRDAARAPRLALRRFRHDLRVRHRTSLLGLPLAFAPAVVVTLWATLATRSQVLSIGEVAIPYPAWVLISVVLWQAFAEALSAQVEGLAAERSLLARIDLPVEAIILERAGGALFHLLLKLVLAVAIVLALRVDLPWTTAALPLLALPLLLLGTAVGLWIAPLGGLYPDLVRALPAALTLGFFLTPVVFAVPETGPLRLLLLTNPVTPLLGFARDAAVAGTLSHPVGATAAGLLALLLLPTGWFFYRLALPYVVARTEA
jgi:lipopolysaccharide transport system permease protein